MTGLTLANVYAIGWRGRPMPHHKTTVAQLDLDPTGLVPYVGAMIRFAYDGLREPAAINPECPACGGRVRVIGTIRETCARGCGWEEWRRW